MPIILQKSAMEEVTVKKDWNRSWYYYQCPQCTEEYKSDIPFTKLFCLECGKAMHRNCHYVDPW